MVEFIKIITHIWKQNGSKNLVIYLFVYFGPLEHIKKSLKKYVLINPGMKNDNEINK